MSESQQPTSNTLVEARNLDMQYGDFEAVKNLSFQVRRGEVMSLVGPNGAGKTSTIHMVTGVLPPSGGTVHINGEAVEQDNLASRQQIGYVPDRPEVYEMLTGLEYVQFAAGLYGVKAREAAEKALPLFKRFRLRDNVGELMGSYSHGMRQKTLIIAALVHDPDLIVFDEPIVGLDPYSGKVLRSLIRELQQEGRGILFSTHVLQIAEEVADRVLVMDRGEERASGTMAELRKRAAAGEHEDLEQVFFRLTETQERGDNHEL